MLYSSWKQVMLKKSFILFVLISGIALFSGKQCFAETVTYNHKSGIYHKHSCKSAIRCTKNCLKIEKKDAIKNGGRPCKICGG